MLITGISNDDGRITKVYTNSGTNFSEVLSTLFTGVSGSSIAFSDVNSDGKPDLLITGCSDNNSCTVPIAKLYTNSGTNFSEVIGTPFSGVQAGFIAFSDINSDGKPDVLITGISANEGRIAKLYLNTTIGINTTPSTNTGIETTTVINATFIYPNPSNGSFLIEISTIGYYSITSIEGKVLITGNLISEKNIIETNLPKGIYFVRVDEKVQKLIIQ